MKIDVDANTNDDKDNDIISDHDERPEHSRMKTILHHSPEYPSPTRQSDQRK